jgi:hypothetical protein
MWPFAIWGPNIVCDLVTQLIFAELKTSANLQKAFFQIKKDF